MEKLKENVRWMRKKIIEMAYHAGKNGAHLGAALSCVELMACLYGRIMDVSRENIHSVEHDVFIPSKAHCVLSYYTALSRAGLISEADLMTFDDNLTALPGHPIRNVDKGIEFSGGSLGMGFSLGAGIALGMKRKGVNQKVFVLLGDGECDEGANWEAAQSAAHYKLDNLVIIVDANKLQYDGYTIDVMNHISLENKFKSFGFYTLDIDGHNIEEIVTSFDKAFNENEGKPIAIIANTVKGKGISFMEGQKQWHHAVLKQEQFEAALSEIGGNDGNQ